MEDFYMHELQIVPAVVTDCPSLTEISKAAKAYWGYEQEWLDHIAVSEWK